MTNLPELFELAVRYHKGGERRQAELLYRQILDADPNYADAHHLLGLLDHQAGRDEAAVERIRHALTLDPNSGAYHSNLGIALFALGRTEEALASFAESVRVNPEFAQGYQNLGTFLQKQGKGEESVHWFREALRVDPDHGDAHFNLGVAYKNLGRLAEAASCYGEVLRLNPGHVNACVNCGNALKDEGCLDDAVDCFRQGLAHHPDNVLLLCSLGNALKELGRLDEAARCCRQALTIDARHAPSYNILGNVLKDQGNLEAAIGAYREAIRADPQFVNARSNLAVSLMDSGLLEESLAQYEQALQISPGDPTVLWNRSFVRLLQGDYESGWRDYEYRWTQPGFVPRTDRPRWDGASLVGKTILLHVEQGLGDTLQFIRYAPMVKKLGARVLVGCPPSVACLLEGLAGVDEIVVTGAPLPEFDVYAPLLSLPRLFRTTLATIPAAIPYLHVDCARVARWRSQLESLAGLRVGIAWQGSVIHKNDRYRSVPLTRFAALANIKGVRLVSVQVGPGAEQIAAAGGLPGLTDAASAFDPHSLADLAAVLMNLDLVVTVDTAVAHVAGGLGVPVWVLVPFAPDWRWLLGRSDSPWYPTMRLFRQPRLGAWDEVFADVVTELAKRVATHRGAAR